MAAPIAFLFQIEPSIEANPGPYNRLAQRTLVAALLNLRPGGSIELRQGDVALDVPARRVLAVQGTPGTVGTTTRVDPGVFTTLIWDLCDSVSEGWHRIDLERLAGLLGRLDVFAVCVSNLVSPDRDEVHAALSDCPGYLGAIELDLGNPSHVVVAGYLPQIGWVIGRDLVLDRWDTEDPFAPPGSGLDNWWDGLPFGEVRYASMDSIEDLPGLERVPLSLRGSQTAALIAALTEPSHLDLVARELSRSSESDAPWPFEVDLTALSVATDAIVEEHKLTEYLLNPGHPKGMHKARLFREVLGIEREHADYLASQLKSGLVSADAVVRVRSEKYGVQYHVTVDITGINGEVRPVRAAWQVSPGQPPRLITAYLEPSSVAAVGVGLDHAISPSLDGTAR